MDIFDFSYLFPSTIEELDKFSGKDFEVFLFEFFQVLGYSPRLTDDTNDKGIDLIVKIPGENGTKNVGVQAKRWKSKVGADEIRSMLDGREHYNLNEVWIVTTSDLTSAAVTTAMNNRIKIISRDRVSGFLEELKKYDNVRFREKKTKSSTTQNTITTINKDEEVKSPLYEELRELRNSLSKQHKLYPVYLVYNNATIDALVKETPVTLESLLLIPGFTDDKIKMFGADVIEIIKNNVKSSKDHLKEDLIALRKKIAKFNKLKNEFVAFNDISLEKLVEVMPETIEELKTIKGFTDSKINLFGNYLVKNISELKLKHKI